MSEIAHCTTDHVPFIEFKSKDFHVSSHTRNVERKVSWSYTFEKKIHNLFGLPQRIMNEEGLRKTY